MCWVCYRKLREANLPLALRLADVKGDPAEAWAFALSPSQARWLIGVLRRRVGKRRPREFIDTAQLVLPGGA